MLCFIYEQTTNIHKKVYITVLNRGNTMESIIYNNEKLLNNINYDTSLLNITINNMGLAEATSKQYKYDMLMFLKCNKVTLEDLISKIKPFQNDRIENNMIIKYNPNDSDTLIKQYYDIFINTSKNKGNSPKTIKTRLQRINSILKHNDILIPNEITKKIKLENTHKKMPLLENKDIAYILNNHCNIHQKAIYSFMASTGIRRHDVFNFTIKDFLMATYKYHKTLNLDEFLNKIDNNFMVGYWEFIPNKTKKSGLVCKTCNSSESSNYIIESLKARLISINKYNENHNSNIELTEEMPLFSNKRQHYIGKITNAGFTNVTMEKNKIYKDYKIKSIENDFKNDEIDIRQYNKLKENIPIFKLHNLRHYFISVLSQYIPNNNISLIMEAHTSNINTDKYYIGESSELYNEDTIREAYNNVEQYLTFNNSYGVEINNNLKLENRELLKRLNDYEKLEEKYNNITNQLNDTESKLKRINDVNKILSDLDKLNNIDGVELNIIDRENIFKYIIGDLKE